MGVVVVVVCVELVWGEGVYVGGENSLKFRCLRGLRDGRFILIIVDTFGGRVVEFGDILGGISKGDVCKGDVCIDELAYSHW